MNEKEKILLTKLEASTNNKYQFVKYLGEGAFSRALLLEDLNGNQIVLKYSLNNSYGIRRIKQNLRNIKKAVKRIFFKQKFNLCKPVSYREDKFANKLKNKCSSFTSNIQIPKSINYGDFIIEAYGGEVPSPELLSSEKGLSFARDLGKLLAFMHKGVKHSPSKEALRLSFNYGIKDTFDVYGHIIPEDIKNKLRKSLVTLKKLGNDDEFKTNIHGDIRRFNLLYNEKSDKFSLIDFELARIDNVYFEFMSGCPAHQKIPYKFILEMVDSYNQTSEIKINKEKLKCFYIANIITAHSCDALIKDLSPSEYKQVLEQKIKPKLNELEQAFLEVEPQK